MADPLPPIQDIINTPTWGTYNDDQKEATAASYRSQVYSTLQSLDGFEYEMFDRVESSLMPQFNLNDSFWDNITGASEKAVASVITGYEAFRDTNNLLSSIESEKLREDSKTNILNLQSRRQEFEADLDPADRKKKLVVDYLSAFDRDIKIEEEKISSLAMEGAESIKDYANRTSSKILAGKTQSKAQQIFNALPENDLNASAWFISDPARVASYISSSTLQNSTNLAVMLAGGITGGPLGAGIMGGQAEMAGEAMERVEAEMQKRGLDSRDPLDLISVLQDKEFISKVVESGAAKGAVITGVDAALFGAGKSFATKLGLGVIGKGVSGKVLAGVKAIGALGAGRVGEGVGELAGQVAAEIPQGFDPANLSVKGVLSEMAAFGPGEAGAAASIIKLPFTDSTTTEDLTAGVSVFGGTADPDDSGVNDKGQKTGPGNREGVSIPKAQQVALFGEDFKNVREGAGLHLRNPKTGEFLTNADGTTRVFDIVDHGPSEGVIAEDGNTVDMTEGVAKALGLDITYNDSGKMTGVEEVPLKYSIVDKKTGKPLNVSQTPATTETAIGTQDNQGPSAGLLGGDAVANPDIQLNETEQFASTANNVAEFYADLGEASTAQTSRRGVNAWNAKRNRAIELSKIEKPTAEDTKELNALVKGAEKSKSTSIPKGAVVPFNDRQAKPAQQTKAAPAETPAIEDIPEATEIQDEPPADVLSRDELVKKANAPSELEPGRSVDANYQRIADEILRKRNLPPNVNIDEEIADVQQKLSTVNDVNHLNELYDRLSDLILLGNVGENRLVTAKGTREQTIEELGSKRASVVDLASQQPSLELGNAGDIQSLRSVENIKTQLSTKEKRGLQETLQDSLTALENTFPTGDSKQTSFVQDLANDIELALYQHIPDTKNGADFQKLIKLPAFDEFVIGFDPNRDRFQFSTELPASRIKAEVTAAFPEKSESWIRRAVNAIIDIIKRVRDSITRQFKNESGSIINPGGRSRKASSTPAPITAIHFSREPGFSPSSDFDISTVPDRYIEDSVFGEGIYLLEPKDEKAWKEASRFNLGGHRNEVVIDAANPLIISPDTLPSLSASDISNLSRGHDAIIVRGFKGDESNRIGKRTRELWTPEFPEGKTNGRFVNVEEFEAAHEKASQEILGIDSGKFSEFNDNSWLSNQIFVPKEHAEIINIDSEIPEATELPGEVTGNEFTAIVRVGNRSTPLLNPNPLVPNFVSYEDSLTRVNTITGLADTKIYKYIDRKSKRNDSKGVASRVISKASRIMLMTVDGRSSTVMDNSVHLGTLQRKETLKEINTKTAIFHNLSKSTEAKEAVVFGYNSESGLYESLARTNKGKSLAPDDVLRAYRDGSSSYNLTDPQMAVLDEWVAIDKELSDVGTSNNFHKNEKGESKWDISNPHSTRGPVLNREQAVASIAEQRAKSKNKKLKKSPKAYMENDQVFDTEQEGIAAGFKYMSPMHRRLAYYNQMGRSIANRRFMETATMGAVTKSDVLQVVNERVSEEVANKVIHKDDARSAARQYMRDALSELSANSTISSESIYLDPKVVDLIVKSENAFRNRSFQEETITAVRSITQMKFLFDAGSTFVQLPSATGLSVKQFTKANKAGWKAFLENDNVSIEMALNDPELKEAMMFLADGSFGAGEAVGINNLDERSLLEIVDPDKIVGEGFGTEARRIGERVKGNFLGAVDLRRAEKLFSNMMDMAAFGLAKTTIANDRAKGVDVNSIAYKKVLSDSVSRATGRTRSIADTNVIPGGANSTIGDTINLIETLILFAPTYYIAAIESLTLVANGKMSGDIAVRSIANALAMSAVHTAGYMLLKSMFGEVDDDEWYDRMINVSSPKWLAIDVPFLDGLKKRVKLGNINRAVVQSVSKLYTTEGTPLDRASEAAGSFLNFRISVPLGVMLQLYGDKDTFEGDEGNIQTALLALLAPAEVQSSMEENLWIREHLLGAHPAAVEKRRRRLEAMGKSSNAFALLSGKAQDLALSLFGLNVSNVRVGDLYESARQKEAHSRYGMDYDALPSLRRAQVSENHIEQLDKSNNEDFEGYDRIFKKQALRRLDSKSQEFYTKTFVLSSELIFHRNIKVYDTGEGVDLRLTKDEYKKAQKLFAKNLDALAASVGYTVPVGITVADAKRAILKKAKDRTIRSLGYRTR